MCALGVFKRLARLVNLNDKNGPFILVLVPCARVEDILSFLYILYFFKLEILSSFFLQKCMYTLILVCYAFSTAKVVARVNVAEVLTFFCGVYIITHTRANHQP